MNQNQIITIGRQVGSGGRLVGKLLAERLGLAFYDHEILSLAARESGIRDEFFESHDEKGSLLSRLTNYFAMSAHMPNNNSCLTSENLFKFQSDAIRRAASEGGAVFVGRASDYILRDYPNRTDVFIMAPISERIRRASEYFNLSAEEAHRRIETLETARAEYYNFFTNKTWGMASSYDICINSGNMSIEQCADLIIEYIEKRESNVAAK